MTTDAGRPSPTQLIAFLSDFNLVDPYVGIVKGVIAGINPESRIIDITHGIAPQDVTAGALMLAGSHGYFPAGTVFLAVVDPGVGSERKGLIARLPPSQSGHIFILPDNGLITGIAREPGTTETIEYYYIENSDFFLNEISSTFHARDIFAPVAAHITRGVPLEEMGNPCSSPVMLKWPEPEYANGIVRGQIIYVDAFGNLITNIPVDKIPTASGRGVARIAGRSDIPVLATYSDTEPGRLLCLGGSFGFMEIAANQESAARILNIAPGAEVEIAAKA